MAPGAAQKLRNVRLLQLVAIALVAVRGNSSKSSINMRSFSKILSRPKFRRSSSQCARDPRMQASSVRDPRMQPSHVISEGEWRKQAEMEAENMRRLLGGGNISRGKYTKHPIYNFIFEYYMFKPKTLFRYSPGLGKALEGASSEDPHLSSRGFSFQDSEGETYAWADPSLVTGQRLGSIRWAQDLLKATSDRKPELFCHGLHEWAMLYHPEKSTFEPPHKYQSLPLRVTQKELNDVVDKADGIRCTHFDAYRFFSKDATPRNNVQLTRQTQLEFEQPGCLHANMDLFKWTVKLTPWIPSHFLYTTLKHAIACRVLDMRASPYDVEGMGEGFDLSPIQIETVEGQAEYQRTQAELWKQAQPIRAQLIKYYEEFLTYHEDSDIGPLTPGTRTASS